MTDRPAPRVRTRGVPRVETLLDTALRSASNVQRPPAFILAGHNGSGKSTLWHDRLAHRLQIPLVNADRLTASILPPPDPQTGRIDYFARGRGIGDCGATGGYAWTGTGFALTAFSMMGECKGIGPNDWITLFRSEVKTVK